MSETTLTDLQTELQGRLQADAILNAVAILIEDKAEIVTDVNQALGPLNAGASGLVGACVLVRQPSADDDFPDVYFSPVDSIWTFTVIENPVVNRATGGTTLRALTIARRIHRVIKNFLPTGLAQNFTPLKPCIAPNDDFAPLPAYDVRFGTRESDPSVYFRAGTPQISIQSSGGGVAQMVITSSTPGAVIYYTVAGGFGGNGFLGFPSAQNQQAVLYAGVFPVNIGVATIRAAAFYPNGTPGGPVGSDVAFLSV